MLQKSNLKQVTADHWSKNVAGTDAFSPQLYWLAIPEVMTRYQAKACGGKPYAGWVDYCVHEFLGKRMPVSRMLSIGCGSGGLERDLFNLNAFRECDGVDIAGGAISIAVEGARSVGATGLKYSMLDVEQSPLPHAHYDAVWFNGSFHHIRELERVCSKVRDALAPDGWLFFNEYVGSKHFGFGKQQTNYLRKAFALIPPDYRKSFIPGFSGQTQEEPAIPDPIEVSRVDPSEAVRSNEIMNVVGAYFDIKTKNDCGGTLLQFLLQGISGNFVSDRPESIAILKMLFAIEDCLIDSGTLGSDFVVVAAQPKKAYRGTFEARAS